MATDLARRKTLVTAALMAPAAIWLFVFLVLPFIAMLVFAFGERAPEGGYQAAFTLEQFGKLPSRATAFWNTLILAPLGAFVCLVVAYPVAYFLAIKADQRGSLAGCAVPPCISCCNARAAAATACV